MTELTTSATKLYNILKAFKKYYYTDKVRVWGDILGAKNTSDTIEVSLKLSQLFILCNEVKSDIESIENAEQRKIYLNALGGIEFFLLNNNLLSDDENNLSKIQSQIHPDTLGLIFALGQLMKEKLAFKEIDKDILEELKQKIGSLRDEIKESDIEADLKNFLEQQLNKIETAIDNYQIRSSSGLDKTIKEVLGNIVLTTSTAWKVSKEGREKIMNVIKILVTINGYISLEERLKQLPEFIKNFLPPRE